MDALVLDTIHRTATVQRQPIPSPGPREVLIKVSSIALNPVDALYVAEPLASDGRIVGSDFAGTIVDSNDAPNLGKGQRVAGFVQGACSINERPGAFAEYVVCPADLLWKVPDLMSLEDAATLSLCSLTAAQAIFHRLGLSAPFSWRGDSYEGIQSTLPNDSETFYFFIYGASTSVGMYAAQLIRHVSQNYNGRVKLIGAASPARFPMLKAEPYEYDFLVDYRDESWPGKVRDFTTGSSVHWTYDCISEGPTVRKTSSLLQPSGKIAVVRSLQGGAWTREGLADHIQPIYGTVWEGLGVEILYQNLVVPASLEARRFAVAFYAWLSEGIRLQPIPVRRMPGGLGRVVQDGFALLGAGGMGDRVQRRTEEHMRPIAAEKLVYSV